MLIHLRKLALILAVFAPSGAALADTALTLSGRWALDAGIPNDAYTLAGRNSNGIYMICFDSGNVKSVTVSMGDERSVISRGSCTVFSPTAESGIRVNFSETGIRAAESGVALGTFRVMLEPPEDMEG